MSFPVGRKGPIFPIQDSLQKVSVPNAAGPRLTQSSKGGDGPLLEALKTKDLAAYTLYIVLRREAGVRIAELESVEMPVGLEDSAKKDAILRDLGVQIRRAFYDSVPFLATDIWEDAAQVAGLSLPFSLFGEGARDLCADLDRLKTDSLSTPASQRDLAERLYLYFLAPAEEAAAGEVRPRGLRYAVGAAGRPFDARGRTAMDVLREGRGSCLELCMLFHAACRYLGLSPEFVLARETAADFPFAEEGLGYHILLAVRLSDGSLLYLDPSNENSRTKGYLEGFGREAYKGPQIVSRADTASMHYSNLHGYLETQNQREAAEKALDQAEKIHPESSFVLRKRAVVLVGKKEFQAAQDLFARARKSSPDDRQLAFEEALSYADSQPEEAKKKLEAIVESTPGEGMRPGRGGMLYESLGLLAVLALKSRNEERAVDLVRRSQNEDPFGFLLSPVALRLIGRVRGPNQKQRVERLRAQVSFLQVFASLSRRQLPDLAQARVQFETAVSDPLYRAALPFFIDLRREELGEADEKSDVRGKLQSLLALPVVGDAEDDRMDRVLLLTLFVNQMSLMDQPSDALYGLALLQKYQPQGSNPYHVLHLRSIVSEALNGNRPENFDTLVKEDLAYLENHKYRAAKMFELRGQAELARGNVQEARLLLEQGLHVHPNDHLIMTAMGRSYEIEGNHEAARLWYQRAQDTTPLIHLPSANGLLRVQ